MTRIKDGVMQVNISFAIESFSSFILDDFRCLNFLAVATGGRLL